MTDVEVVSGPGTVALLPDLVAGFAPHRVLVVGGPTGLRVADARGRLAGYEVSYVTDVHPNPRLPDVLRGCAVAASVRPDLIVGIGGGSAMDVAKMLRGLPPDAGAAMDVLTGRAEPQCRAPLVLVPTTAGTGSEVTGFATVYVDGVKYSLDHPSVHANVAIVDPELTHTCPDDVTFSGALDALAHAIESLWSLRSTSRSRELAAEALHGLVSVLREHERPLSPANRAALSTASTRAGLAIDRSRTTAGHAFAYPLTARFGVPHGLACALNLVWLLPFTARHLSRDCQDPRGQAFVRRRLGEIGAVLGRDGGATLAALVRAIGFSPWLDDYGVRGDDLSGLAEAALGSGRATNGPVRLAVPETIGALRGRIRG
ncbi:MAG: hypothetical protein AUI14_18290 [Actinobacteria bacterium 13_2_20CM_2_71_6]|nr:MAG: hypothetical protein AUI14_18290 [Actinobacteria bacterium 13_2_20CM_2_71_6]